MHEPPDRYSADLFARRDLQNTDLLAFRAVAERGHLRDRSVLDFGCGTGRSTRFLKGLGGDVTGVDHNPAMIARARVDDPDGTYVSIDLDGARLPFADGAFDAVFSSWVIVEHGDADVIVTALTECFRVLRGGGLATFVTNSEDFYRGNWLSCVVDFPDNQPPLRSGQVVRALLVPENIPVRDHFWSDADYRKFFDDAGFRVIGHDRPLGRRDDPLPWKDERVLAPYHIYYCQR